MEEQINMGLGKEEQGSEGGRKSPGKRYMSPLILLQTCVQCGTRPDASFSQSDSAVEQVFVLGDRVYDPVFSTMGLNILFHQVIFFYV